MGGEGEPEGIVYASGAPYAVVDYVAPPKRLSCRASGRGAWRRGLLQGSYSSLMSDSCTLPRPPAFFCGLSLKWVLGQCYDAGFAAQSPDGGDGRQTYYSAAYHENGRVVAREIPHNRVQGGTKGVHKHCVLKGNIIRNGDEVVCNGLRTPRSSLRRCRGMSRLRSRGRPFLR